MSVAVDDSDSEIIIVGKADDAPKKPELVTFETSGSQMEVLTAISQGKSVFFSGAAGTGKSFILKVLKDVASASGFGDRVAFTASTGVAACNIGGLTINSWAGIGIGTDSYEKTLGKIMGRQEVKARWLNTEILVIDEISMLAGDTFTLLSEVFHYWRLATIYIQALLLLLILRAVHVFRSERELGASSNHSEESR